MVKAKKLKRSRSSRMENESRGPSDDGVSAEETAYPTRCSQGRRSTGRKKGRMMQILVELKDETTETRKLLLNHIESNNNQNTMFGKILEKLTASLEKISESHNDPHKQLELHTNAPRSQWNQGQPPRYRFVCKSKMDETIDKGKSLEMHVALVDFNSGQTVKDGPLASATVEFVALDAKFNQNDNQYNWPGKDFRANIIKKTRQGNSATVNGDGESIVSKGQCNLENGEICHRDFSIFCNSGNKKVRIGVMLVSPNQERVLEGLSNPFFVRGHDRPNRTRRGNGNQEQNQSMSQNPSHPNSTQADGNGGAITPILEGQHQTQIQRTTLVPPTEPATFQQHRQAPHLSTTNDASNNRICVRDGCPEQNSPIPNDMHNQLQQNSTRGLGIPSQSSAIQVQQDSTMQNEGDYWAFLNDEPINSGIDMEFNMNPRVFPVRLLWDRSNVEPSKRRWNLFDKLNMSPQQHFGSLSPASKQKSVLQTRHRSGVLIEPLDPDDSDEERPLNRRWQSKYQLRFVNKVCEEYYTRDQIKADDGNLLRVALFDENNTKITSGPLSSASVEVIALHGDFNVNGQDYWTSEEFSRSVVCPPPGEEASSVLGGDRTLILADGEACLSYAFFQITSFCARTGKFKMGVRLLTSAQEERIQEGISEPFRVMDHHLPGFISNCSSWKSDLEPPVFRASTSSAKMTENVLLAASKIGSILTEEAAKAVISKLSEKVVNLKELPRKIEEIGKELNMIDKVTKQIVTTSLNNELVKGWISEVRNLAYNIEDVIDKYSYYAFELEEETRMKKIFTKARYITVFSEITEEITQMEKKLKNVVKWKDQWLQQSQLSPNLFADIKRKQSQDCILDVVQDDHVGIEENMRLLTEWLNSKEQSTQLITVFGMGGLGKTTLVKNLYEKEKNNFTAHAWIGVSQNCNVVELLRDLLRNIEDTQQPQLQDLNAYDLKQKIKERLTDRKCLIVLDDLWNQDAYTQMRDAFEDQASCVIITTRQEQVAALAHPTHQLKLKPLGYSDAFSLFCRKAFYSCIDSKCPSELEKLANNIVDMCQGVPLAIVTMGGLLSALAPVKDVWNETYKQFQNEMKNNDQVRAIINLSYKDLPGYLRNCFLYCSLFPEGHLMSRESLVWQWVAEGFVGHNDQSTLEEVADKYLRELIQRNMLEAVENDGLGRVSTCKMHDLVRDLAYSIAKEEMYGFARDYGNIAKMDKSIRRLSSCGWKDKTSSSSKVEIQLPRLRTLVAHGITESSPQLFSVLSASKYLAVIDLQDSEIVELSECIGNLFNLRYLGLRSTRVKLLPQSIRNLSNLQTLDMKQTKIEELPQGIVKLRNLRHILANRYVDEKQSEFRYLIGVQAPKELSNLEELQTLETVEAGKDLAEQLRKLKKLRSVWIDNIISSDCASIFTTLSKMPVLSSLSLSASNEKETLCLEALNPQSEDLHKLVTRGCWADKTLECSIFQEYGRNLKYLAISWCHLQEDPLQLLTPCVPNLTYLSLNRVSTASTLVLPPGCFPQLKTLVLKRMPCVEEVEIRVGALRQIESLYIESLVKLNKIPQGIKTLCSLKKLWLLNLHKDFRAQWNSKGMSQKMQHVREVVVTESASEV